MFRQQRLAEWFLIGGIVAALVAAAIRFWPDAESSPALGPGDLPRAAAFLGVIGAALVLRRREGQTREAESGCRRLLDAACDGLVMTGPDRRIAHISPRGAALFGYPPSESLVGQPLSLLLPDWSPLPSEWPTTTQGQVDLEAGAAEFQGRTRNQETLALEITVGPVVGPPSTAMALLIRDVTRAKRVREELRAKEAHLRLVVGQMPAILWTTDVRLQITSTIGAGLAALNLKPAEVIGMSMLETLGRDDPECTPVSAHLRALHGESLTHEMEWKGRNFQVRVDPLRNHERRITGTIGVVLDVTDHKQTVEELKARVCQQAAIAGLGQQALAGGDVDGLIAQVARAVRATLDVGLCEMLELAADGETLRARHNSGWGDIGRDPTPITPDSPAGHAVRTGSSISAADMRIDPRFADDVLVSKYGVVSSLSVLVHGRDRPFGVLSAHATRHRPFTEDDRNFLQAAAHVLAAALDRKNADATQTRLVALLEATTDAVAIAGADHRLLYVNRAGRAMFGLAENENLMQRKLADFYVGELRARFLNEVVPVALRKGAWSGEIDLQGRKGDVWTVSQVVLAHRSPEGSVEFLSTVSRDLGERLHLEGQLRQAQKMEAVGRLAGGIAHDFNNLLCIITGYSEMALAQLAGGTPLHGFLVEVCKAGNRAATLTRQLLAFSRKSLLTPKVLDLDVLVRDAGTMLRRLIGEDVELAMVFEPNLPAVKADPNQLEQVLMNLAVNARDAMPQGGRLEVRTARVRLDADQVRDQSEVQPGSYVLLAVSDTGCGMDAATRARIFEPFFTTKGVGKGTGLGLAMVYGIVKQSGGHIDVETAPGRGCTFRVYLPFAAECSADDTPAALAVDAPLGTETVLLAEDEDGVRTLVLEVLRRSGYTVLEARDGVEALALSEGHPGPIHLLLTDVVMPRLGGGRLARRVNRKRPETRVLFMSGFADSTLVRHEVINGDVECLLKPFSPEVLARKVREILDSAEAALSI